MLEVRHVPFHDLGSLLASHSLELDIMDSKAPSNPLPTIVIEDTANAGKKLTARQNSLPDVPDSALSDVTATPDTAVPPPEHEDEAPIPGALADKLQSEIPEWFKVGWRQVSGIDDPTLATPEARNKVALSLFLKEQYYGDWYHNAAIIIVVRFSSCDQPPPKKALSYSFNLGDSSVPFHCTFPAWLGLALRPPSLLQHILQHLNRTLPAQHARRHPTRARQNAPQIRTRIRRMAQQLPRPLLAHLRARALADDQRHRAPDPEHQHARVPRLARHAALHAWQQSAEDR